MATTGQSKPSSAAMAIERSALGISALSLTGVLLSTPTASLRATWSNHSERTRQDQALSPASFCSSRHFSSAATGPTRINGVAAHLLHLQRESAADVTRGDPGTAVRLASERLYALRDSRESLQYCRCSPAALAVAVPLLQGRILSRTGTEHAE